MGLVMVTEEISGKTFIKSQKTYCNYLSDVLV